MTRPRTEPPDRVSIMLRLPKELHADLLAEAADRDVSANWLATRILRRGLDAMPSASESVATSALTPSENP